MKPYITFINKLGVEKVTNLTIVKYLHEMLT